MADLTKLVGALPTDVVADLEAIGVVDRLPLVRSGGPIDADFVVVGISVVTTLVTFAQVPQTWSYLAQALGDWRRRATPGAVRLEMRGPRGKIEVDLNADAEASDIEAMLRLLQRADPAQADDDDGVAP